jgi:hypothetical protein
MSDWQPIDTAPTDGRVIKLRNVRMREGDWWVYGYYGDYKGQPEWVSRLTPMSNGVPFPAGQLVIPDEWAPAEDPHHD